MLQRSILFVFILLTISLQTRARIWRLNNNTNVKADFATMQAAHDSASNGDTIHVEGSPSTYGSFTFHKKLVILGAGYFLDENPGSQALLHTSKLDHVNFYVGSSGSVIMGIDLRGHDINVYAHDIVIKRNKFASPSGNVPDYYQGSVILRYQSNNGNIPVSNVIITQNYGLQIYVYYPSNGILISNNYIGFPGYGGDNTTNIAIDMHANAVALIQNNIFRRGLVRTYNSNLSNNVMYRGQFAGTGNLVSNNLANASQFGNTNGNQENIDMTTVFVGSGAGISTDGQWKLKTASPAIGAGYGSTSGNPIDAGMYGGNTPYLLAGLPPIPAIYFFENQPIGSNNDPIDVTVKVKSVPN